MNYRTGITVLTAWVLFCGSSHADVSWDFTSPPLGFIVTPPQTWTPGTATSTLALPGSAIQGFTPPPESSVETPPFRFHNVPGARVTFDMTVSRNDGQGDSFRELLGNDEENLVLDLLAHATGQPVAPLFDFKTAFPNSEGLPADDEEPIEVELDVPDQAINTSDAFRLRFRYYHFALREFILGSIQIDNLRIHGALPPGDLNGDGVVSQRDVVLLLTQFGRQSGALFSDGDLNGDHAVSLADFMILQSSLSLAPSPAAIVPEPNSIALALVCVIAAAGYGLASARRASSIRATRKPNAS